VSAVAATPSVPARRVAPAVMLAVAVLLLPACGKDQAGSPAPTAPPTTAPPPVFPLRGTPVDDPAAASRPALVVKIDNTDEQARPQAGLADADLVFEEKVEGPLSRFAAVFHARQPAAVGPVRSGRTTDLAIVGNLNRPLYAFSGANGNVLPKLRTGPLVDVGYDADPDAYERRKDRTAPYNLWASPDKLRRKTPPGAGPPPPALTFGDAPPPEAVPAATASYDFGPNGIRVSFAWNEAARGWVRTQNGTLHVDADGNNVAPANVVIQLVGYLDTGDTDVAGTPVPEAQLVGTGTAWILTRGVAVKATWSRPDAGRPTEYRLASGTAVTFAPGQTWVALVPATGVGYTVTRADGSPVP
jgi:hypothetical protein